MASRRLAELVADPDAGEQHAMIVLSGDGSELASLIPVRWRVKARLRATPSSLYASDVERGGMIERRLLVATEEDQLFRIKSVKIEGGGEADSIVWKPSAAVRHEIKARVHAPEKAGVHRLIVKVATDLEGAPQVEVPWSMTVR